MTPTLIGRWQTRLVLLAILGGLVSASFAIVFASDVYFRVLLYVALFGIAWDVIYIALQELRWERDWPAVFQVINGFTEGALIYALISIVGLPGIAKGSVSLPLFAAQYGLVWLSVFLWVQGPMRAFFPLWRFHGGRLLPFVSSEQRR